LDRRDRIDKIRETLLTEMDSPGVCTKNIRRFLEFLNQKTAPGWRHFLATTNWDFLLQREVLRFITDDVRPSWLVESHVFHLNGTVEGPGDDPFRSPFLLPDDPSTQRTSTREADIAINKMFWATIFVVVGMSFECRTDRFLLQQLNEVEDHLPIGESEWSVVNPDPKALKATSGQIQNALPSARVLPLCCTMEQWQEKGFGELRRWGVFTL
jgi:hypothetical protein